jgi:hypothetical protein
MKPSKHNIDTGIMIEKYLSKHRIPKSSLGKDIRESGLAVGVQTRLSCNSFFLSDKAKVLSLFY